MRELQLMPSGMGKTCNNAMRGEGKWAATDGARHDTRLNGLVRKACFLRGESAAVIRQNITNTVYFYNILESSYQNLRKK
jgi:hypothetical protein